MSEQGQLIRLTGAGEEIPDFNHVPIIGFGRTGQAILNEETLRNGPPSDYWLITDQAEAPSLGTTASHGWPKVQAALGARLQNAPFAIFVGSAADPAASDFREHLGPMIQAHTTPTLWFKAPSETPEAHPHLADQVLVSCWGDGPTDPAAWHLQLLWGLLRGVSDFTLVGQDPADLREVLNGQEVWHNRGAGTGPDRVKQAFEEAIPNLEANNEIGRTVHGFIGNIAAPPGFSMTEIEEALEKMQELPPNQEEHNVSQLLGVSVSDHPEKQNPAELFIDFFTS